MRGEKEMYRCLLDVAKRDPRVLAAYLNGSRADPEAPRDALQDYDVVYVVEHTAPFLAQPGWIDVFGPRLMLQEPDRLDAAQGLPVALEDFYGYLLLLADGNRIDLHLESRAHLLRHWGEDSLTVPLLDKAGLLAPLPQSSNAGYRPQPPTAPQYDACCNNFWWCTQNVGKGLWRGELPYAKGMLERPVREALDRMVCWWIGMRHAFAVHPGKMGKYFARYLPAMHWALYAATWSGPGPAESWRALGAACALFASLGREVGAHFGFAYPETDEANMRRYLGALHACAGAHSA